MSESDVLQVSIRKDSGTRSARRMRAQGQVPAVLYGHGEGTVSLAVSTSEIEAVLRHGGKVVQLQGEVSDSALVRDVQWDPMGNDVLHLDLARVTAGETVAMTVPIELRGDVSAGVLKHTLHEIPIHCAVSSIPDRFQVSVNALEVGQSVTVADLELPSGATTELDPTTMVVQCIEAAVDIEEEEPALAEGVEPEVIGRKADSEDSESES